MLPSSSARCESAITSVRLGSPTARAAPSRRSRVERGIISPSVGFLERVVAACGEELVLDTREREVAFDESQLAEQAAMPVGDRLLLASNANRLAGAMTGAAARALAGRDG